MIKKFLLLSFVFIDILLADSFLFNNKTVILGLMYGSMLTIGLYNLLLFIFTKSKTFLYYSLSVLFLLLYLVVSSNFTELYLSKESANYLSKYLLFYLIVSILLILLFTREYLEKFDIKNRESKIYLASLVSGVVIYSIFINSQYVVEILVAFESLYFSIALADKLNQLQKEKESINQKIISHQLHQKANLERKIDQKTKNLQDTLKQKKFLLSEIHNRVKNNMDLVITMLELQSRDIEQKEIKDKFTQAIVRIKAMSNLHKMLYKSDDVLHIDTKIYIEYIINDLKVGYIQNQNIEFEIDVNANLPINKIVYVGIIIAELVSNSLKYAFDSSGKIKISLQKNRNCYILTISDNGCGFDLNKNYSTLGVVLVKTIAKNQLNAETIFSLKNGVKVVLKFDE